MHIGIGTELLVFIVSLITFPKYKHTVLKFLPIYFGYLVFQELFCLFFYRQANVWLFNIQYIIEFNFLAYIYWRYLSRFGRKLLVLFLVVFNGITLITCALGIQKFMVEPVFYSYVIAGFMHVVLLVLILNKMLRSNAGLEEVLRNIMFWFCFGTMLYFATTLPIHTIKNWVESLGEFRLGLFYVLVSALLLKNIIFIFGFLWSKKNYTY